MFYHIFSDKPLEDKSGTVPYKPNFPPPVPPQNPQNEKNQNSNSL